MAEAIAAFERSSDLMKFSSRFDQFLKEQGSGFDPGTFGYTVVDEFRVYNPKAYILIKSDILEQ